MTIADELIAVLGFDLRGEENAKRYDKTLDKLTKRTEQFARAAGKAAGIAVAAAATGFGFLGKSVLDTSSQFETFQATLETIEGSSEKAKASLDWIAEFGKTTPYEVAGVTDAFVKLKAYGIDPIANDTLRILGDTASAMGKSLDQAVEAFADASTGEFERLKEFGIKAKTAGDNVTFSWTKNGEELTKTVKKNATEIRGFLLDTMGDRFSGAMDKQSKTWKGMLSNLGDGWTDFQRRVGNAGFFDNLKGKLSGLLDTVSRLDSEGKLDRWAKSLSDSLSAMVNMIWAVGERVASIAGFLADNFDSLKAPIMAVGGALALLLVWAFPVVSAFVAIGLAVDDFISYLQGGESVIGDMINWLSELPEKLSEVSAAFVDWISNIDWGSMGEQAGRFLIDAIVMAVSANLALLTALFVDLPTQIVDIFTSVDWGQIVRFWVGSLSAQMEIILGVFRGMISRVMELIYQWFDIDLLAVGQRWGQQLLTGLQSIGGAIRDWFASLLPAWAQEWFSGNKALPGPGVGPIDFRPSAVNAPAGVDDRLAANLQAYLDKVNAPAATEATLNDNRQDNRAFPLNTSVTINQTVTQPTAAPAAAASATGSAVSRAVAGQRSQIEGEPSF